MIRKFMRILILPRPSVMGWEISWGLTSVRECARGWTVRHRALFHDNFTRNPRPALLSYSGPRDPTRYVGPSECASTDDPSEVGTRSPGTRSLPMNASRRWIAASLVFALGPVIARAQDATPDATKARAKTSPAATTEIKVYTPDGPFLVKPYLQLGHTQATGKLVLMWHATDADVDADWSVEYQPGPGTRWQAAKAPTARRVVVSGIEPHRVYHTALTGLEPGVRFAYRVSRKRTCVFEAEARAESRTSAASIRGVRRLRRRHARGEGDRLPGIPVQAGLHHDPRRHRV